MKRKILKSSLFIFSLVTLTTIGVNATESSTVTSSTSEVKTEFKVDHEDTVTSESTESIQPRTVFTPEDTEENVINSESTEDTVLKSDDSDVDFLYNEGIKKIY